MLGSSPGVQLKTETKQDKAPTVEIDTEAALIERPLFILVGAMFGLLLSLLLVSGWLHARDAGQREASQISGYLDHASITLAQKIETVAQDANRLGQGDDKLRELMLQSNLLKMRAESMLGAAYLVDSLTGQTTPIVSNTDETTAAFSPPNALLSQTMTDGATHTDYISRGDQILLISITQFAGHSKADLLVTATDLQELTKYNILTSLGIREFSISTVEPTQSGLSLQLILSNSGEPIGWYAWRPTVNATDAFRAIAPLLLLAVLAVGGLVLYARQRARTISKTILENQKNAEYLALHDPLTGLANRTLLAQRMDEAKVAMARSGKVFAFHLIDLDHFKNVNDTLGHQAGDELIRQVAKRLADICRAGDTIARLGGDEFAILQPEAGSAASAARLSRRILEQLSRVFQIDRNEVFVTTSSGVTLAHNDFVSQEEMFRQADIALYRAKSSGRNQFCFFEKDMDRAIQQKRRVETDLRQALMSENSGLSVVYQPQFSANARQIRGLEALVRWRHPEHGVVPPNVFVPVAEETGLIRMLGEFVMRESFRTAAAWPDITMAVNVSPGELKYNDYVERTLAIAEECNINPEQIELEITETVLLDDSPKVARTLKALKAAGFKIALDDFGTGYSSLSYLRRHQVDKLKIDQSFVSSIGVREDANAVVQAIIHLGEALGLTVTAEGVETVAQRDTLRSHGCAYLQGYLLSRPLTREKLDLLMTMIANKKKRIA